MEAQAIPRNPRGGEAGPRTGNGVPEGKAHPRQKEQRSNTGHQWPSYGLCHISGGQAGVREAGALGGVGSIAGQVSRVLLGTR